MPNLYCAARRARLRTRSAGPYESLEPRRLLSVSLDPNGWTVVTPPAGARVIYVSSSTGSDQNSGLLPAKPVKSLSQAESLLRNNSGDEMLLKRGDVWNGPLGVWRYSGRSAANPMVIGAYGSGARPLLNSGSASGMILGMTSSPTINYLDIIGLDFHADARDPASPTFTSAAAATSNYGIYIVSKTDGLLIEDCAVRGYGTNISVEPYFGNIQNISIRRSDLLNAYSANSSHSEGLYANGVQGLLLEGNVFDHNGWNASVPGAEATIFNHDAYLSNTNTGVVIRDNVFANASSHGLQARSGGDVENNVFLNDPIGMSFGLVNGSPVTPGGVSGIVNGNVFLGTGTINGQIRGYGIEIGNTAANAQTIVSNNIFRNNAGGDAAAFFLEYGKGVFNPTQAVGINNLTVVGNIVYDWTAGISIESGMQQGGSGAQALNSLSIRDNIFQGLTNSQIAQEGTRLSPSDFVGNLYIGPRSRSAGAALAAQSEAEVFTDPARSAATYSASLGNAGTDTAFVAAAAGQTSQAWQPNYSAAMLVAYEQAGFQSAAAPHNWAPPTPPVAAASIARSVATTTDQPTLSLTVSYTAQNGVDPSSVSPGNVALVGAHGKIIPATAVSIGGGGAGPIQVSYTFAAPAGVWRVADSGRYTLRLLGQQIRDTNGYYTPAQALAGFKLHVARAPLPPRVRHISFHARGTQSLSVQFSSEVGTTINVSDLALTDGSGTVVSTAGAVLSYNPARRTAIWTFAGAPLPPGRYRVTILAATLTDAAGRHLDGNGDGIGGDDFVWRRLVNVRE